MIPGKLFDQEQYSRWPYLVIEAEASLTNSVIDIIKSDLQHPDVTVNNVDKCHKTGPTDNDGKQNIVTKFKKHSSATKVFRE